MQEANALDKELHVQTDLGCHFFAEAVMYVQYSGLLDELYHFWGTKKNNWKISVHVALSLRSIPNFQ